MWVFLPFIHLPAHKEIDFAFFVYALFVCIWEATCFINKMESKFSLKLLYYSLFTYSFIMIYISGKIKLFIPLNNWFHLSKPTHIRKNRGTISIKKAEHQRTDFKLWCWRRLSRIPRTGKEIKPVKLKGNQWWIFIGRTDAEASVLWPPDVKSRPTGRDPDVGKEEEGRR